MCNYTSLEASRSYQIGMSPVWAFQFTQPKPKSKLGINVEEKKEDIKLLFYKRQAPSIMKEGLDPEDVLQEIYKGILIRNEGTCPYDSKKSAFSTYVVMVMNCIVMNLINKQRRERDRFVVGKEDDVACSYNASYTEDPSESMFLEEVRSRFKDDLLKVYDSLREGLKQSQIGRKFGWEIRRVNKYVREVRTQVASLIDRKELIPC